jgi:hypothetical protein
MEETMRRIDRKLLMVVSSLALATTTTVVTIVAPAQATTIAGQSGPRKALYQSELEQNLLLRTAAHQARVRVDCCVWTTSDATGLSTGVWRFVRGGHAARVSRSCWSSRRSSRSRSDPV